MPDLSVDPGKVPFHFSKRFTVAFRLSPKEFPKRIQEFLSAYAEDPGREPGDECVGRTLRSSKCEGGWVASADCAEEIKDTPGVSPWSFIHVC